MPCDFFCKRRHAAAGRPQSSVRREPARARAVRMPAAHCLHACAAGAPQQTRTLGALAAARSASTSALPCLTAAASVRSRGRYMRVVPSEPLAQRTHSCRHPCSSNSSVSGVLPGAACGDECQHAGAAGNKHTPHTLAAMLVPATSPLPVHALQLLEVAAGQAERVCA